jgi:signal transduction histidine kinase
MPAFSSNSHSKKIFPDQVRLLYAGAIEAYIATAVNVVLLAAIQWYRIPPLIIIGWLLYMFVVTASRALLVWKYWRSKNRVARAPLWNHYYLFGSGLAGAGWGGAGVFLYPPDSLPHQVFLAFVIGGMAAGGVAVLSPRMDVFFAFFLPAVSPIAVRFSIDGDPYHTTMTAMIVLYSGALLVTACRFHQTIRSALELRSENADLVEHLMGAKRQADALNEDLKREIIERRNIETALRESQEDLEIRVEQRTRQLQKKNEQLLQTSKLASIGELATGVAHELNNPLNNIGLTAANLLDYFNAPKEPGFRTVRENLTLIADQVRRASQIINSLRTFGRAAGTEKGPVNLHDTIRAALMLMDQQLRLNNIALDLKLTTDQPVVRANAIQLEQVFVNLLSNARDAVKHSASKTVMIATCVRHDVVEAVVHDTGIGIPPEDLECIFDPFFTTKEVGSGTGLGLSISYGIIADHGGTIVVNSGIGDGTTFTLRLPLERTLAL